MNVDLSRFPWPFESSSAEEILMLDFLEHFPYRSTDALLLECYRMLMTDGRLIIQVPDASVTMRALVKDGEYPCNSCGTPAYFGSVDNPCTMCLNCKRSHDDIAEAAMMRLYGGQDYVGNFHQTCFTSDSLVRKCEQNGLRLLEHEDTDYYRRNWTLRMTFGMGDGIW